MKKTVNPQLERELSAAGASKGELTSLVTLADRLEDLRGMKYPHAQQKNQVSRGWMALTVGIPAVMSLALGMLLIIEAQTVGPGSIFYPVQKASDSVAISLEPSYRATVMMRRADQVRELVSHHAAPGEVYATLADYERQAVSYKSTASNYAAFDYCKYSLQQAAVAAPAPEKQAITSTLESLNDV